MVKERIFGAVKSETKIAPKSRNQWCELEDFCWASLLLEASYYPQYYLILLYYP